jgi:hypothetical protein
MLGSSRTIFRKYSFRLFYVHKGARIAESIYRTADRGVRVQVLGGSRIFSSSSRPALGSAQSFIQWVPGTPSSGVQQQGCEADHSLPTSAKVRKTWYYTSAPDVPSCAKPWYKTTKEIWEGTYIDRYKYRFLTDKETADMNSYVTPPCINSLKCEVLCAHNNNTLAFFKTFNFLKLLTNLHILLNKFPVLIFPQMQHFILRA